MKDVIEEDLKMPKDVNERIAKYKFPSFVIDEFEEYYTVKDKYLRNRTPENLSALKFKFHSLCCTVKDFCHKAHNGLTDTDFFYIREILVEGI